MLLALTVVTGLVDSVSYLFLGLVFAANMIGNIVFLGFSPAAASGFPSPAVLLALGGFAMGGSRPPLAGRRLGPLLAHRPHGNGDGRAECSGSLVGGCRT